MIFPGDYIDQFSIIYIDLNIDMDSDQLPPSWSLLVIRLIIINNIYY